VARVEQLDASRLCLEGLAVAAAPRREGAVGQVEHSLGEGSGPRRVRRVAAGRGQGREAVGIVGEDGSPRAQAANTVGLGHRAFEVAEPFVSLDAELGEREHVATLGDGSPLRRPRMPASRLDARGELCGVAGRRLEERAPERDCTAEGERDDGEDRNSLDERPDESHGCPQRSIARSPAGLIVRTSDSAPRLDSRPAVDLYEYQGKQLFARAGIPVSDGRVATTAEEARAAAEELGGPVVVKAQVLVGGRGKAGGIKLAGTPAEAEAHAAAILGMDIRGRVVRRLWIERASDIAREYYLSVTFDRGEKKPLFMLTTEGGVDIEEVAATKPDALARLHVDPLVGFQPWQGRWLVFRAGIDDPGEQKQVLALVEKLYGAFVEFDAMLCEVNPLIVTPEGEVKALDSKFTVDDNALFRHPDVAEMRDVEAADPRERLAREKDVTYVKLDGEVGILGNGAGLVMSTLDVIDQVGGRPANFCDLGGGGDAQGVVDALEVITSDDQVRAILFNIFGGITRCDEVARGILTALGQMTIEHPIVVRLDGTNAEEGRRLLAEADAGNLYVEETMLSAAERVVELAR
jgi:succinyl-CoA synthetase beta subunit